MAKKLPKVSILERRLKNPFGSPSEAIKLKEGDWATRWVSETLRSGRVYQVQNLGWDFVTPEEVVGQPSDLGCQAIDNRLVRGDAANREVLMKMPRADFEAIQRAKAETNLRNLGSGKKLKEDAANRATQHFGTDEAGEAIYNSDLDVRDSRVAYELEEK